MRVVFAENAVLNPECWSYLDKILYSVEDGWHEWQIDDPDILEESEWLQGTRSVLRKLFEEAAVQNVYPRAGRLHNATWIVSLDSTANTLAPQAAASFFTQPLRILMENRFSDGQFLNTVLAYLATAELSAFLDQCQGEPLMYDSIGGTGQLPRLINKYAQGMANKNLPLRAVVITDSDARFPGHESRKAQEIAKTCDKHGINCMILSKRTIENYIPDEVLHAWAEDADNEAARPRIEVICRLTREQRDHLAIKQPFRPNKFKGQEQNLFATMPNDDVKIMRKTNKLGNDLIELFQTHKNHLSADALRKRDSNGDLDKLVSIIEKAL